MTTYISIHGAGLPSLYIYIHILRTYISIDRVLFPSISLSPFSFGLFQMFNPKRGALSDWPADANNIDCRADERTNKRTRATTERRIKQPGALPSGRTSEPDRLQSERTSEPYQWSSPTVSVSHSVLSPFFVLSLSFLSPFCLLSLSFPY